jgi:GTP diphosphokinase / guanosine-3',5'-bis(diphosphate) 3'-diphosphatase
VSYAIKEWPAFERPRERLHADGAGALAPRELLAILIGSGREGVSAVAIAGELLRTADGSLRRLAASTPGELAAVRGVGPAVAARVSAALELGRRLILAELHLDSVTLASGLIHDVVEDTSATLEDVQGAFGDEVVKVVDGLTKISRVQFRTNTEQQVENYRKLLLSMAQDARVILIKLADRLHNMRTLEHLREEKRRRIALETREIYAPLAHRLGMATIKWELEDLCFKFLEPDAYRELARKIAEKRTSVSISSRCCATRSRGPAGRGDRLRGDRPAEAHLVHPPQDGEARQALRGDLRPHGRPRDRRDDHRLLPRARHHPQQVDAACRSASTTTSRRPKSNLYRSLHTTIFGPGGRLYEIQIRTREMHRTAEYGIAAHWKYKEGTRSGSEVDETLSWFRQVLEWQQDAREPEEFMEFLRIDLFQDEIFVFTPSGDVKQLPRGATPIDFAFAVHSEVGVRCAGAKVNGRITPLSRELRNGDTVEILTDAKQRPSRDWLAFVKTARARNKIRQWIKEEEFGSSVRLGKDFIEREVKKAQARACRRTGSTRWRRRWTCRTPSTSSRRSDAATSARRRCSRSSGRTRPSRSRRARPRRSSGSSHGCGAAPAACGSRGWRT